MDVDIMVDCLACGSQNWKVDSENDRKVRFVCTQCDDSTVVGLTEDYSAYDCHVCQETNWNTFDKTENHRVFSCSNCEIKSEFWIRN